MVDRSQGGSESRPNTIGDEGKRLWLYPFRMSGKRSELRRKIAWALMAFYIIAPHLTIAGLPLIRFDVARRTAFLVGLSFGIKDAGMLLFVVLTAALVLSLATSLRGRIWCGFACPQTVFVEWLFRPIEEWIEGDAHHRRVADRQRPMPWSLLLRKTCKHALYLFVAFIVANTFLGYFVESEQLLHWMSKSPEEHPQAFMVMLGVFLLFYLDLAWFREQFCSFLCPYARFQTLLLDEQSPVVAYDEKRGEPRGRQTGAGDCIDCQLCVRVCPTGIDIRKGLQMECIMCERCVDACAGIMASLKRQPNLIGLSAPAKLGLWRTLSRPRVLVYALLLATVLGVGGRSALRKQERDVMVLRAPRTSFVKMPDGRLFNQFVVRVVNPTTQAFVPIHSTDEAEIEIICGGCVSSVAGMSEQTVSMSVIFSESRAGQDIFVNFGDPVVSRVKVPLLGPAPKK